ncbi:hypothetical protein NDU88_001904 [Pleurodeles waltl]|uniref:Uncharacterized protein n=1 Tax=Pleurodeles waltl TaxID=8319 RepID=A0AAV7SE38_PLEWA|nr:hypothetical protein NDU88_001904 [Pleurodeles waltl]
MEPYIVARSSVCEGSPEVPGATRASLGPQIVSGAVAAASAWYIVQWYSPAMPLTVDAIPYRSGKEPRGVRTSSNADGEQKYCTQK